MKSLARCKVSWVAVFVCLAMMSCAMKVIRPKESTVNRVRLKDKLRLECLLISRKKNKMDHFEARFGKDATIAEGELFLKKALLDEHHTKKVVLLSTSGFRTEENQDLRFIASQMGCGSIFSYQEKQVRETSLNFLSLFYPTLVGMYIFPGTNIQLGVQWDIQIFDVHNESALLEARWYGASKLYMFRPGSYDFMASHAYREAVQNVVSDGLSVLSRESVL